MSLLKKALLRIKKVTEDLLDPYPNKPLSDIEKENAAAFKTKPDVTVAQGQNPVSVLEEPKAERKFTKSQKKILNQTKNILTTTPKLSYTEVEGIQEGPTYSWGEYSLSYRHNNFLRGVTNRTARPLVQYKNSPFP
ncbi:PCMP-E52 [Acrasis kona]|uniref:PCMP-E52 n=1 Tax=Acrasis kona TaxID=1008807 RepID=A0AAW2YT95_9EUKA